MPLNLSELGILGVMLIIMSGMFKLIAFMVRKSYDKKCQATTDCPLNLNTEKLLLKMDEIHSIIIRFRDNIKAQVETVSGKSEKITKESMEVYHNLCSMIEEVIKTSKIKKDTINGTK